MKFFDIDWRQIFDLLPVWDGISPGSRQHFLNQKLSHAQGVIGSLYASDLPIMRKGGLVVDGGNGKYRPTPERGMLFRRIFMQLLKQQVFSPDAGSRDLDDYLTKHLLREDINCLSGEWGARQIPRSSIAWSTSFMECEDAQDWEKCRRGRAEDLSSSMLRGWGSLTYSRHEENLKSYMETPKLAAATQTLVRMAYESQEPLRMNRLREGLVPGLSTADHATVFLAAVRYALLFPGLDPESLEAVFWIWPPAGRRRNRKPLDIPQSVEAVPFPCPPFLFEDCLAVLARAMAEPLPVRKGSGNDVYEKTRNEILAHLDPIPQIHKDHGLDRLTNAIVSLQKQSFLKSVKQPRESLKATSAGMEWLQKSVENRLMVMLDNFRHWRKPTTERYAGASGGTLSFSPTKVYGGSGVPLQEVNLSSWLEDVWSQAEEEKFYQFDGWVVFHSQSGLPPGVETHDFLAMNLWDRARTAEEGGETIFAEVLKTFFFLRLVPLGGVRLARNSSGDLCFSLNATGRYLLGGGGQILVEDREEADILLKPDFEIVFLGSNPIAQAELSAVAELCGKAPGVVLRITKASILKAVEGGYTHEKILELLTRICSKSLPANIQAQIRDWVTGCREVYLRKATLVTCPDESLAERLCFLFGPDCERISDLVIALPQDSIDPLLRRKLQKEGVFIKNQS